MAAGPTPARLATVLSHDPPSVSQRLVRRDRVLALLNAAKGASVVCVQAPGGYGKTTAVAQWVAGDDRPTVWLTVRQAAADAQWMAQTLLDALTESGLVPGQPVLSGSANPASWHLNTLPVIEDVVSRAAEPFIVVMDDAGAITGTLWECLLESVASSLPSGAQLVIVTRDPVPTTLWRLQSRGALPVVGSDALAFDETETARLLESLQVRLGSDGARAIVDSTRGWPVAVYLAGLDMQPTASASALLPIAGSAALREYLREEIVGRLPGGDAAFLSRVSVLTRLDADACDEVAGTTDSLRRLRRLSAANQLLAAQDESAEHFRMHPLLADVLSGLLQEHDPARWRAANAAASNVLERRDDFDGAVHHAKLAGDGELLSRLVWTRAVVLLGYGQYARLERWTGDLDEQLLARHCGLALAAAWGASHAGDMPRMSRMALAAVEKAKTDEDPTLVLDADLLVAAIGAEGVGQIVSASRAFIAGKRRDDMWQPVAHFLLGATLFLRDESSQAMAAASEGRRLAEALNVPLVVAHCLASMADIALAEGEERKALLWIRESRELAARYRLEAVATAAPIFTTSAVGYVLEGRFADARHEATRALRLIALMRAIAPWHAVQGRLALAQVNIALGDLERARVMLDEAGDARSQPTASPRLDRMYAETSARLSEVSTALVGVSSLTTAEVRVLQYLPTHLSFPEIADELFVSRHTIKTQALAAYRKLGVHSRSEAIIRAREAGLLPKG